VDGGGEVDGSDQLTGGEPEEGETEAGAANMRLASVRRGKNSLLTRRHAGGAGDTASSKATTHMSQQGLQQAGCVWAKDKVSVGK
jgi:hypothetical protein